MPIRLWPLAAAAALCGCAAPRSPFAAWIDRPPLDEALIGARAAPGAVEPPERADPLVELPPAAGPDDLVAVALERNPAIRRAMERVRRMADRIPQVASLEDPMFELVPVGDMAQTAAGEVGLMTGLSQRLPWPGRLAARTRLAEQEVAEAIEDLAAVRLEVAAETRAAWWSLYETVRAIEVTERNRALLAQLLDVAEARFRAGATAQEDLLRASVELHGLESDLSGLRQQARSVSAALNRLLARPAGAPISDPAPRTLQEIMLDPAHLRSLAFDHNPMLRSLRARLEADRERVELARLERRPDVTVSVAYNLVDAEGISAAANGEDQWWVGFGMNLPIWTARLDAAEREALRGRLESAALLDDESNRLAAQIEDLLARIESAQRQATLFRDLIVPQAAQSVEAALSSYRAGRAEFLSLIDSWRQLLAVELAFHHTIAQFERSFAELQQRAGLDLTRRPASEPQP
jgi:outer membrane protein TolC